MVRASSSGPFRPLIAFGPLALFLGVTLYFRMVMPPWLQACVLSTALVLGFKWHTLVRLREQGLRLTVPGALRYFILWPGMDAEPFFSPRNYSHLPTRRDYCFTLAKMACGAVLIWGVVRLVSPAQVQLRGWTAAVGVTMAVHFGLFELAMLQLHREGFQVIPFMRQPFSAVTLGEFWGMRWSTGFRYLTYPLVFKPVQRALGMMAGLTATFIVSGLIHEFLMCYPASRGYGLPTAYFIVQTALTLFQRSALGRHLGINKGAVGRVFTITGFIVPMMVVFWYMPFFPFILLPLLHALRAF